MEDSFRFVEAHAPSSFPHAPLASERSRVGHRAQLEIAQALYGRAACWSSGGSQRREAHPSVSS